MIWERIPKSVFVGIKTMKIGVFDATICFNEGTVTRCKVLELLGISPGENMRKALISIDRLRVAEADRWVQEATKEARVAKRSQKRKLEDKEHQKQDEYGPGMH